MNKKILVLIVSISSFFLNSCNNRRLVFTDDNLVKYCESINQKYRYEIEDRFEGKFTDSFNRNVLVFFRTFSKDEKTIESKESCLFEVNKFNRIERAYYVPFYKFTNPNVKLIKEIDQIPENKDITKYDNTIIVDLNKNGKLEILFFEVLGSVSEFKIVEFTDDKFVPIFEVSNYLIEHIDFDASKIFMYSPKYNQELTVWWQGKPFNHYYYQW